MPSRSRRPRAAGHWPAPFPDRGGCLRPGDAFGQSGRIDLGRRDGFTRTPASANRGGGTMELTVATILVTFAGVFLICFMKGAFGGGFSIIGIPLLSIVMDPVTAGGLLAPLFIAMDLYALRYWKPSTWSKPDLVLLLPGLVAGIGLGYVLFRFLDHRAISIVMAVTTLAFVGLWLFAGGENKIHARS